MLCEPAAGESELGWIELLSRARKPYSPLNEFLKMCLEIREGILLVCQFPGKCEILYLFQLPESKKAIRLEL